MLMLEPFDPETTIALRLLYSVRDFLAEPPVLSRASLRMRFTWKREKLTYNKVAIIGIKDCFDKGMETDLIEECI